ncbi:DNA gyrase inhibitor YacG [Phaeobacter sp.]|uniref:DNA gyrase inhibitor YacG n=1 Tax=Phaeobacter sp. TaxID=1902409 RepID=UPI0025DBAEA9|nr:DNA gyrase inhibitor YacG [Phaeobacter sp.]
MSCPMCGETTNPTYRPFCSSRCANQDLAKWLNGSYSTPITDPEDVEIALEEAEKSLSSKH